MIHIIHFNILLMVTNLYCKKGTVSERAGELLIRPNRKIGYEHGLSNTSLMLATDERETIFDCNVAMIILGQVNETELRKIVYDAEDRKGSRLRGKMS